MPHNLRLDSSRTLLLAPRSLRRSRPTAVPSPSPHPAQICICPAPRPPIRPASRPTSCAPLPTRQSAQSFNQPLSFDTSSVTDMRAMFWVRSARVPGAHGLCNRAPMLPLYSLSCLQARTSPCFVCPHFDSAGRARVQPAADSRHVQRHGHELHVQQREGVQPAAELRHVQRHDHGGNV